MQLSKKKKVIQNFLFRRLYSKPLYNNFLTRRRRLFETFFLGEVIRNMERHHPHFAEPVGKFWRPHSYSPICPEQSGATLGVCCSAAVRKSPRGAVRGRVKPSSITLSLSLATPTNQRNLSNTIRSADTFRTPISPPLTINPAELDNAFFLSGLSLTPRRSGPTASKTPGPASQPQADASSAVRATIFCFLSPDDSLTRASQSYALHRFSGTRRC